jgi:hypothetical protein
VLVEPFGGLCAGLEMVLSNGIPVSTFPVTTVKSVTVSRLLGSGSWRRAPPTFSAPSDVPAPAERVAHHQLLSHRGGQWLVVAGWECQDLSAAGKGAGLAGQRSSTFCVLLHLLGALQQLQAGAGDAASVKRRGVNILPGVEAHSWGWTGGKGRVWILYGSRPPIFHPGLTRGTLQ